MTRFALALIAALLLAGCATDGAPPPDLQIAPRHLSADLCTHPTPRPLMPATAAIQKPQTPELIAATKDFLDWLHLLIDHDKDLTARAEKTAASDACK